jgi:hypothetical protein
MKAAGRLGVVVAVATGTAWWLLRQREPTRGPEDAPALQQARRDRRQDHRRQDERLDEGLEESFPASDPPAVQGPDRPRRRDN